MKLEQIKKMVDRAIQEHKSDGWNNSQAKSLAWGEYFEEKELEIEWKYQGNFIPTTRYDCYCKDCDKGNLFAAANSIRLFIQNHKDHKTTTCKVS